MKRRVYRVSLVFCTLIMIFLLCTKVVYAYDGGIDWSKSVDELALKPENWIQGSIPNVNNETIMGDKETSSIQSSACSTFAMTYALVKMGYYNPSNGDNPYKLIKTIREKKMIYPGAEWGYFDYTRVNELYPEIHYEWRDNSVSGMNFESAIKYIKGLWNEGYYVVAIVYGGPTRGHCIFLDGINSDGSISIGDSGFIGTTWDETYGKYDMRFSYLEVMSCDGKPFLEQPSIYDDNILRAVSDKEVEEYNVLLYETDVEEMRAGSHDIAKIELQELTFIPNPEKPGRGFMNIEELNDPIIKDEFDWSLLLIHLLPPTIILCIVLYYKKRIRRIQ